MELDKLRDLIRMLENSTLSEIEIEEGGHKIKLKKPSPDVVSSGHVVQAIPHMPEQQPAPQRPAPEPTPETSPDTSGDDGDGGGDEEEGLITIDSPMVGVFYAAPAPGEEPFVKPGDTVETDQTLCIVEAMKLMNEVTAKYPAEIRKCLVENGEPVEFGQALFAVRPLDTA